ncbi:MAG: hypothetical protein A2086_13505 [Spirochaetes bacterium GWD1_27_9]|nr:MAG: hypothetical protein A2Z98_02805 [Spirochaetes bacterium GWB1_27_13]OHD23111.1 MAG: hypothetical protein A2Y34_16990 [Spirochaetes bacterium GWC1_27_15]OHD39923.1 MAG: hypothetical protein A2086_13505 [Spirochaetes bacterium GWD1_27_9]
MSYRYTNYNEKKKSNVNINIKKIVIICLIVFLFLSISTFTIILIKNNIGTIHKEKEIQTSYKKMFFQKNYIELIEKMDKELKISPFDVEYLVYRGYSYFFLGEDEKNIDKRKFFFSISISDLRKAMAIGVPTKNKPNLFFCIGKIYYYFGESYYNLSIEYLNNSLKAGNKRKDLYYILGLNYSYIGNYSEAIKTFTEALNIEESDLTLLAIGVSHFKKGDFENAKIFLEKVIKISNEPKIKEKSLLLMGEILFEQKIYDQAKDYFDKVIEINENNSSAYFYRGEVYFITNNPVKARAEWRKTLEIDPSHIRALKRIY